ncbi:UNVERIFIED_CONTAM: putative polygalacturonase [Sesamum radiatum]|uniref:Polygalacturonase n=1 Tax=Sesamum radiatum TaxID=300843 RepID=A0AAW2MGU5_SESRA
MDTARILAGTQVIHVLFVLAATILLRSNVVHARHLHHWDSFDYCAISCRVHSASLTDFGGGRWNVKLFRRPLIISASLRRTVDQCSCWKVVDGRWESTSCLSSQLEPLPSYGRGRDTEGGRYISLIFGTNLTDVVITGDNGTIDGQGETWWNKFHKGELQYTRPYLIEIMYSENVQISNLTLVNSPSWNVHPIYSRNVIVQGLTILAPVTSPNTDGINPDSCTNTRIEDCYIVSGDDCVAVKSGWDEYGIAFGMPTKQLVIRWLTCISPFSAVIALGSEMSGGIQDVRAEDILAINTESGVRIKTAVGRGGYVKDIYVRGMTMKTMKWAFWMTGNYGSHADNNYDPNALPVIQNINYRDMVAENVTMAARLEGIPGDPFTGICISNVTIGLAKKAKKVPWNCTDIEGISSGVVPQPCDALPDQGSGYISECNFPTESLPIDNHEIQTCSYKRKYSLDNHVTGHL